MNRFRFTLIAMAIMAMTLMISRPLKRRHS